MCRGPSEEAIQAHVLTLTDHPHQHGWAIALHKIQGAASTIKFLGIISVRRNSPNSQPSITSHHPLLSDRHGTCWVFSCPSGTHSSSLTDSAPYLCNHTQVCQLPLG